MKSTRSKKIMVLVIMILAVTAGVWYFIRRRKTAEKPSGEISLPPTSPPAGGGKSNTGIKTPEGAGAFPLTTGSKGTYVTALQQLLKDKGQNIAVDGVFGPKTKAALTKVFKLYSVPDVATFNKLFGR